ncbi:MAG: hypothetical protein NWE86_04580 [Candidatus Bathyarchaeota archaeon]|jgi:hypothetical protein|nr:hypothetical protein [Candidatus Bathyarchaeota archaeon]
MEKLSEKSLECLKEAMKSFDLLRTVVSICFFLGIIFAVIGVIGEVANLTLGLSSTIWLLLAIASFLAPILMLVNFTTLAIFYLLSRKNKD